MSTVMSQQLPKEDEEEEDEEQGEAFSFGDDTDEEKNKEDSKGISSDTAGSDSSKHKTSDNLAQTGTDGKQLLETSPPAGQEGNNNKDATANSSGGTEHLFIKIFMLLTFLFVCSI